MADSRVSDLVEATSADSDDLLYIVAGGNSRKIKTANLFSSSTAYANANYVTIGTSQLITGVKYLSSTLVLQDDDSQLWLNPKADPTYPLFNMGNVGNNVSFALQKNGTGTNYFAFTMSADTGNFAVPGNIYTQYGTVLLDNGSRAVPLKANTTGTLLWFDNNAVSTVYKTSGTAGFLNLGTTYTLTIPNGNSGQVYLGDGTIGAVPSDLKLKTNITPANVGLDFIDTLEVKSFNQRISTTDESLGYGPRKVGLIAQSVHDASHVYPELADVVNAGTSGYLGIDYNQIVAILINAVKELKAEVNTLKQHIQNS